VFILHRFFAILRLISNTPDNVDYILHDIVGINPAFIHTLSYAIPGLVVYLVFKKTNIIKRLEVHFASTMLLAIANLTLIILLVNQVVSLTNPSIEVLASEGTYIILTIVMILGVSLAFPSGKSNQLCVPGLITKR